MRSHFFDRLQQAQAEHGAAAFAVAWMLTDGCNRADVVRELGRREITVGALQHCRAGLEAAYTVRLFSEFKKALRSYWRSARRSVWRGRARDLVDRVAGWQSVPADVVSKTHQVREYRNHLLHGTHVAPSLDLLDCKQTLCKFLAHLPHQWAGA